MEDSSIWIEKYRPTDFSELKGQKEIVKKIEAFVKQKNIPHILFAGPAGSGKTSLALIIAKQLFKESWRDNLLELNSSDERGIDIIRKKVKDFARTKAIDNFPYKIIHLDECDSLTKEAQQALRRTMETYSNTCRFILSCVSPDTKILLPGEIEITIDDFMKNFENKHLNKVQNFKENLSKEDLVLACIKLNPKIIGKSVLEITTTTGRKIKVTNDHKLLTSNGWKSAGELIKEDKILIYPNIEGTFFEEDNRKIIDINRFIDFLTKEEEENLGLLNSAYRYAKLKTIEKNKIINKIRELNSFIKTNKGLTKREKEIYDIIKNNERISRLKVQELAHLSRIRTNQLLKSIENKGFILRYINKKAHYFIAKGLEPTVLRNLMDIKKIIEKEYNIKISYTSIKKSIDKRVIHGKVDQILGELKRKDLLDLTYDSKQIGALSRIVGFMLGDGHLTKNHKSLIFTGNELALKEVKKDLENLGYSGSKITTKEITQELGGRKFKGNTTSFRLNSKAFSVLLQYLEVPKGDKAASAYKVPTFIKNGTKFVKREFLRSLFGCEGDKPSCKRYNFNAISLRQNKIKILKAEMVEFLNEIRELLNTFEVNSYITIRDKKERRKKDSQDVLTFELILKSSSKNLYKFFSKIGYAYEGYKDRLSRLASEYLKHKLFIIEQLKNKLGPIKIEINNGRSIRSTAKLIGCSPDFVAAQLKGKNVHLPRKSFISFDKWINKYEKGMFIENEIIEITKIECNDVRDITCLQDHNFISNGFISHNCNFSSKIIEPIQSRCVVFKFRPLEKSDIEEIISKIAKDEKLKITKNAINALYEVSDGDVRKMENILQSCAVMNKEIDEDIVYSLVSAAKPKEIREVLNIALKKEFLKARELLLDVMLKHGLSGLDIIKQIQKEVWNLDISSENKVKLTEKCGEIEFRMVEGSDEFVQIEALLANFILIEK